MSTLDCGERVYINKNAKVEVPYDGLAIIILGFFLCDCSIRPYSIVAGIGKNGDYQVLVGRALMDGWRIIASPEIEYGCVPILDKHSKILRQDLESYRQTHGLNDVKKIVLWPELLLDQK